MMTLAPTGKAAPSKTGFATFPGEVCHALHPNALHGVSVDDALHSVEPIFKNDVEPARVAGFVVEPVQGEGGFFGAPSEFIHMLKAIADKHGILLIADQVQTGTGRTGTWFARQQWPVAPDLITTAKSTAGGFPISGVVGRADVMDAPGPGGLGAMVAIELCELCEHGDVAQPDADLARRIVAEPARRGLTLPSCGTSSNVIGIRVPPTAADALLDDGMAILAESLAARTAAAD